jgi:flavin reductase (DIM6/NTAB) family NADH-FMN oxidoreductase RutF
MFYDAVKNDHGFQYDPFKAIVAPRPIGWVSTLSPEGKSNLAPYSYFNAFSQSPHYVAFGSGPRKDSMRNIEETGEFTFSLATFDLREQMNATSAHVTEDEFELAGLTKASSHIVKPPRVAESPAALECCLHRIVPLPDDDGVAHNYLIIGRVLGVHIDDRFIVDGRVDTAAMRPIARLGYSEYATVSEVWRMRRPD